MKFMKRTFQFLHGRRTAYQLVFGSPAGQEILADLAKFCRANEPAWSEDARHHARLEGRREVWLRIQKHLTLSTEQLYSIYSGHQLTTSEDTDNG